MRTPPMHTPIHVALAESTRMFGQILSGLLWRDKGLEIVDMTADPLSLTSTTQYDVVLISAVLEDNRQKGFELVGALRLSSPRTRAVMLLDYARRDLVVEA